MYAAVDTHRVGSAVVSARERNSAGRRDDAMTVNVVTLQSTICLRIVGCITLCRQQLMAVNCAKLPQQNASTVTDGVLLVDAN